MLVMGATVVTTLIRLSVSAEYAALEENNIIRNDKNVIANLFDLIAVP
jgi:hypothetical protein